MTSLSDPLRDCPQNLNYEDLKFAACIWNLNLTFRLFFFKRLNGTIAFLSLLKS